MKAHPSSIPTEMPSVLKIDGHLDIQQAETVRALLLSQPDSSSLVLDLSAVPVCDLTGLQLLLSARATAVAIGGKFHLKACSPAITAACTALGVDVSQLSTFNPALS